MTNESNRGVSLLALHHKLSSLTAPKDSETLKRLNSKREWRSSLTKTPFKTMFYHRRLKTSIFLTLRGNKIYKMGLMFFSKWAKAERFIISSGKCSLGSEQRIRFPTDFHRNRRVCCHTERPLLAIKKNAHLFYFMWFYFSLDVKRGFKSRVLSHSQQGALLSLSVTGSVTTLNILLMGSWTQLRAPGATKHSIMFIVVSSVNRSRIKEATSCPEIS